MNTRIAILTAATLALALSALGCGSGDGTTSGSAPSETSSSGAPAVGPVAATSLDKQEVAEAAAAACRRTRKGLAAEEEAYLVNEASEDLSQGERIADMVRAVLVPRIEAEIEAIRKTGAPKDYEEVIETLLIAQQEGVEELAALKQITDNEQLEAPFDTANRLRRNYSGFPICSYIP